MSHNKEETTFLCNFTKFVRFSKFFDLQTQQ